MSQQPHLTPVFNPNAEAHAMQSLNAVMVLFQTAQRPIGPDELIDLHHSISRLVDCLFPIVGNNADIAGFASLPAGHYVHPIKTAEAATLLGRSMGMPRSRLITLALGAALMNVGNLLLKQSLLDEPRALIEGEWEEHVHRHPAMSVTALTSSGLPHDAMVAIGQHHERWDGSGYPHSVRGNEISIEARIIGIADSFISLRSQRPYRAGMPSEDALQILASESGRLYEPALVDLFADTIATYAEKEERPTGGTASADASAAEAGSAQQGTQSPSAAEEFAEARRKAQAEADEVAARSASRAPARTTPPKRPEPVAYIPAAMPRVVPTPAKALRAPRRMAPQRKPGNIAARRSASLFSTDVFLRGAGWR